MDHKKKILEANKNLAWSATTIKNPPPKNQDSVK